MRSGCTSVPGLYLRNVTFGGPVLLREAHVDGQMDMEGAHIADKQEFDAQALHVGIGGLLMRGVQFGRRAIFWVITVDGTMDLRDSHVQQLDLEEAVVRDDLIVGGRRDNGSEQWLHWGACEGPQPCLNLRNARVGNLQDDDRAWPPHITLQGFTYTHLGGFGGDQRQDMRTRPIEWWRDWLGSDPVYSAQPYAQLASVLTAAGDRDGAADIRFYGRDRGRSELLRGCPVWAQKLLLAEQAAPDPAETPDDRKPCRWGTGIGLSVLQAFVGYGIGNYTFRAAGWTLALAFIGTAILLFAPGVRGPTQTRLTAEGAREQRGPRQKSPLLVLRCQPALVLLLVTLTPEFTEFFNDPKRERLSPGSTSRSRCLRSAVGRSGCSSSRHSRG